MELEPRTNENCEPVLDEYGFKRPPIRLDIYQRPKRELFAEWAAVNGLPTGQALKGALIAKYGRLNVLMHQHPEFLPQFLQDICAGRKVYATDLVKSLYRTLAR